MFRKLIAWFSTDLSPETPVKRTNKKPTKPKVASTRIGELGEHKINLQLDQLPKEFQHLEDLLITNPKSRSGYSQIDHLVITPFCIFVIETKNYNGEIKGTRTDKYWRVSNRFNMYNPLKQNYGHLKAVQELLTGYRTITYISMISFTMRCRFSIDPELRKISSNELIVYDVELTEFINRKIARIKAEQVTPSLTAEDILSIKQILNNANVTDPHTRSQHVDKVNSSK